MIAIWSEPPGPEPILIDQHQPLLCRTQSRNRQRKSKKKLSHFRYLWHIGGDGSNRVDAKESQSSDSTDAAQIRAVSQAWPPADEFPAG